VVPVWEAIVDSAIISHEGLTAHLDRIKPDVVCVDNVILFPAIKATGKPWIRIISCSENEIPDPNIPPHLSGCHEKDKPGFKKFEQRFLKLIKPAHARFNEFLAKVGHAPYPLGEFFEASPHMNLLLYPEPCATSASTRSIPGASNIWRAASATRAAMRCPASARRRTSPSSM
jgi:hypothetical protein